MDVMNSVIAVAATLAGLWTSAVLQDVRAARNEDIVVASSATKTRSFDMSVALTLRPASKPKRGGRPIR
jgi:hypothetical protein